MILHFFLPFKTFVDVLVQSFANYNFWINSAIIDLKVRFNSTILGYSWLLISFLVFVLFLGYIYSNVFNISYSIYLKYISTGFAFWLLFNNCINEGCSVILNSKSLINESNLPFFVYHLRNVFKNFVIFLVAFIVPLSINFFYHFSFVSIIFILLFFIYIFIFLIFSSIFLSIINIYVRDVSHIINNLLRLLFFVTPIFWLEENYNGPKFILDINPVYHIIKLLRNILEGSNVDLFSISYLIILLILIFLFSVLIFKKYRDVLVYNV